MKGSRSSNIMVEDAISGLSSKALGRYTQLLLETTGCGVLPVQIQRIRGEN